VRFVSKLLAGILLLGCGIALAQDARPNFEAFRKFREQHKYTFQLRTMVTAGLMEIERSKSTQLKPEQAKKILEILTPLQKQPKLTQEQAKQAIHKLQKVLDQRQLAAVDRVLQRRPGMGGPPGGPGGAPGPGGPGGPGAMGPGRPPRQGAPAGGPSAANRPRFDPTKMQNFNPFNPSPQSPMYQMEKEQNDRLFSFLKARAAGKAATLELRRPGMPGGPPPR